MVPFQACSGCKFNVYCSRECQREDWSKHKINCKTRAYLDSRYKNTPFEQTSNLLKKWQARNETGLRILAKLVTTPAKAKSNILFVNINMNLSATDAIRLLQIGSVETFTLEEYCQMSTIFSRTNVRFNSAQHQEMVSRSDSCSKDCYHFLFLVRRPGDDPLFIHFIVAAVFISDRKEPKHNSVDYYVKVINDGAGGLLMLDPLDM